MELCHTWHASSLYVVVCRVRTYINIYNIYYNYVYVYIYIWNTYNKSMHNTLPLNVHSMFVTMIYSIYVFKKVLKQFYAVYTWWKRWLLYFHRIFVCNFNVCPPLKVACIFLLDRGACVLFNRVGWMECDLKQWATGCINIAHPT